MEFSRESIVNLLRVFLFSCSLSRLPVVYQDQEFEGLAEKGIMNLSKKETGELL
jgi:hypothetical protein